MFRVKRIVKVNPFGKMLKVTGHPTVKGVRIRKSGEIDLLVVPGKKKNPAKPKKRKPAKKRKPVKKTRKPARKPNKAKRTTRKSKKIKRTTKRKR